MKSISLTKLSSYVLAGFSILLGVGCATPEVKPPPCPPSYSFHYIDTAHGFSLCLPAKVKKGNTDGYPAGSVVFNNFAIPKGTTLEAKELEIIPGKDDNMQGATAYGHFMAGGVNFHRVKANEGSAGHMTVYIIYTWTHDGNKVLHFDFALRSVNPNVFDPPDRPKDYNLAAQVKLTEEVMSTFHWLIDFGARLP